MSPSARSSVMALLAMLCALGCGGPAAAASQTVSVNANVVKPLTIDWIQDFDLGSITFGPGTWSNATVAISQAGVLSCANANTICTGATKPATYNVSGTRSETVGITCPDVTLVNQSDSTKTLTLVTSAPANVFLTNSGKPGTNFNIGGSVTLNSTTAAGVYAGTFNVTANYQ